MIPRTFPSTYASNGQQQMVVYFLTSIAGLQRWADYIPVKLAQGGVENSYNNNGYMDVTVVSYPTATQQAWKEYIPVYLDDSATDAWLVNSVGYIPYGYALFGDASMIMDMTNTGALDSRVTFSRTTNATLTDSTGTLVYAPHNLLVQSESFDSSAWSKTNGTVTANATVAPNGTSTADLFAGSGTGAHYLFTAYSVSVGVPFWVSCYVKNFSLTSTQAVRLRDFTEAGSVTFSMSTGTVSSTTGIASDASIVDVGDGWFRISAKFTPTVAGNHNISPVHISASATTEGFYAWGAQVNVSTLQPYYPTTVRNLLGFTQEFDNAGWVKTRSSITANATAAPDGSVTADKLVIDTTAATNHPVGQNQSVLSGTTYTLSAYAKAGEITQINLRFSAQFPAGSTFFNLSAGTKTNVGTVVDSTITPVGDGWYRCSITQTANASGTAQAQVFLAEAGSITIATANGTDGLFLWGAQLSDSASLDPYVYNPAAAPASTAYYGPRFDYDPVTLAARGLLIEEQRVNSIRNNTMVGAVAGTPGTLPTNFSTSGAAGLTREIVGIGTFAGVTYIDIRYSGTTSGVFININLDTNTGIAAANGQSWTSSMWLQVVAGSLTNVNSVGLGTDQRDSGGVSLGPATSGTASASVSTAWQRITRSFTTNNASIAFLQPLIAIGYSSGVSVDFTLRIGLPQLELGAFATSVIPTSTAAATRAADVATMVGDNFANWFNAVEGTVFADATPQASTTAGQTLVEAGSDVSNRIGLFKLSVSGNASLAVLVGGATQASTNNGAWTVSGKLAGAYKLDDFASAFNGGTVATDTSGSIPVVNQLTFGRRQDGGVYLNGHLRRISYWPRRLANAELQGVTA